jgi:hypothetical protein
MHYMGMLEDSIIKPSKHCLKKERAGGDQNTMEGMNLFKVHLTHIWNYHNETPLYY